ncbi:MAG: hypothetical protein BRC51_14835 [Cyanobacteria bacterium SW_12_48_29]|nr:MAG: hypothetical protein BRC51_14835 [Cyanobacteria bacterium SW_12_48_29]
MRLIWGDRAYGGDMLFEWVLEHFHCMLEVLERPRGHGFRLVPRAWVVERTLAWISRCQRLSQDDEKLPRTWETFIYLAMIELMLKRVAGTFATSKTPSQGCWLRLGIQGTEISLLLFLISNRCFCCPPWISPDRSSPIPKRVSGIRQGTKPPFAHF